MQHRNCRSTRGTTYPLALVSLCCAGLAIALSSCSSSIPVQRDTQHPEGGTLEGLYSIVFVIHGDGDYLYHDTSGNEYRADEVALEGAKKVAERNPRAEVFVFHQKAKQHFLFFFPLHDGEFFYYRNGRLIAHEPYWRGSEQSSFEPEVDLYHQFRNGKQAGLARLFFYGGHEIPEFGREGYDASSPERVFSVDDLAAGLKGFTRDSTRFDLMMLSTCFGGTPHTIAALGSAARYIVASPDNLHLSYFDLSSLERLDLNVPEGDIRAFAGTFARQSFDRLTREIQTAVSVVVYDADRVQEYLRSVHGTYDLTLAALEAEPRGSVTRFVRCDCADLPAYVLPTMGEGVDVFYRPARFGRSKNKQSHSGWECWKERSGAPISEISESQ